MNSVNFRTFDLNLLRIFDQVMTERSLTRAANKLALTQPAVSNAIKRLRDILGDDLVRRSGQGLAATPLALALWPQVRTALDQLQQSLNPGAFEAATTEATFVLAMADATAAELMPGLVDILEREAPRVSMRAVPLTTRDPRALLSNETADIAIGYFPTVLAQLSTAPAEAQTQAFDHQRLFDGKYVCVMRQQHPLAKLPLTVDNFCAARHLLVSFSGRPYGFVDEALAAMGRQRQVVLTVNQFFTAGQVVAQSNLLAVLPQHFLSVTGIFDQLVIKPMPFALSAVHVDMLWAQRLRQPAAHLWLRRAIERASLAALSKMGLPPQQR